MAPLASPLPHWRCSEPPCRSRGQGGVPTSARSRAAGASGPTSPAKPSASKAARSKEQAMAARQGSEAGMRKGVVVERLDKMQKYIRKNALEVGHCWGGGGATCAWGE